MEEKKTDNPVIGTAWMIDRIGPYELRALSSHPNRTSFAFMNYPCSPPMIMLQTPRLVSTNRNMSLRSSCIVPHQSGKVKEKRGVHSLAAFAALGRSVVCGLAEGDIRAANYVGLC
jgi:hypothetical protein